MAGAGPLAGVLGDALRSRITAVRPRGDVVGLTGAPAAAAVGVVALPGRRIAACRPGGLEPVVMAGAGPVAGVLVFALGPRTTAVGPLGHVVGLPGARAVAGVRVVALAGGRIAACRPGGLE